MFGMVLCFGLTACADDATTTTGTGGPGGSSSSTGGAGGAGGAAPCDLDSNNAFTIDVTPPPGTPAPTCSANQPLSFDGKVRNQGGNIYVDTCAPNAPCAPMEAKISFSGPSFAEVGSHKIPDGTFVHVVWAMGPSPLSGSTGCGPAILLRNLPTWGGASNPTASHARLWLFATVSFDLDKVGVDEDRAALTLEKGDACSTNDPEPLVPAWIKLSATDADVSLQVAPASLQMLTIPSGAQ